MALIGTIWFQDGSLNIRIQFWHWFVLTRNLNSM